jgi:Arc/MetJ-type ribon-helix-helix transcriptional regulator
MTIDLTPEQEQRLEAVMRRGAYESVADVLEAALAAVEQRTLPGFAGTQEQLDALLLEGMASAELSETDFWNVVDNKTGSLLANHRTNPRT